jgi:hypothetical protein
MTQAAMSRTYAGSSASSRSASWCVRQRTPRVGSFDIRTTGALSNHCHLRALLRRIDRTSAGVRLTVAAATRFRYGGNDRLAPLASISASTASFAKSGASASLS